MDRFSAEPFDGSYGRRHDNTRPTIVLVHGAWHGPWCWQRLQFALHAYGWDTTAPRLRSVRLTDSRPAAGLRDDVTALLDHVDHVDGPVALVAHSYGGMPATEAAALRPGKVTQLVYLAAYLPQPGENLFDIHGMPTPDDDSGTVPVPHDPIGMLYNDVDRPTALAAAARLRPQSMRSWTERIEHADRGTTPKAYLPCTYDQALPVSLQEKFAAQTDRVVRLDSGHSPFLSQPQHLAKRLDDILLHPHPTSHPPVATTAHA